MERQGGLPEFDHQPDHSAVLVLRRQDGAFVAAFSAQGATKEDIVEAAHEDYRVLVEARATAPSGLREDEARKAGSANDGAGRSRLGEASRTADAEGDRARGDRTKAAGDARRERGPEARPPPQPAESGEEERNGRPLGRGGSGLPPLPSEQTEHLPMSHPRQMRWYGPKFGGFEWREVPQTDEQALEAIEGSPHSAACAETYREWRGLGASIRAALIRAGDAAKQRSEIE